MLPMLQALISAMLLRYRLFAAPLLPPFADAIVLLFALLTHDADFQMLPPACYSCYTRMAPLLI